MSTESDLRGHRILVVEDDYCLAIDTARVLAGSGAAVLGPCADECSARNEIEAGGPTGAVVDVKLGNAKSFGIVRILRERGIPVLFVTAYDRDRMPAEFQQVQHLQKPVEPGKIVSSLMKALGNSH